jgi:hypothetical protein
VRPELIQKSWSKLLTQFDDGCSEDENLPLSQWRNKTHLANIVRDIANFVRDMYCKLQTFEQKLIKNNFRRF